MTSRWAKLRSRFSQVTWDELQTRAGQEFSKRLEWARYRVGLIPSESAGKSGTSSGTFFFSSAELPERVRLLRELLPQAAEGIVQEADEICRHRFRLLGYEAVDFGEKIDWHLDPIHGKRAPATAWFKVPFLSFSAVGDHKIIWELSRHQHLVKLAKAWCLTHDPKYVNELERQWYGWQAANPYPMGINWASSLEVAFRSVSWIWISALLAGCSTISESFQNDLQQALSRNGRYIERYLSTYFSPNTHLIGEAMALFFIGTLSSGVTGRDVSREEQWKRKGRETLLQQADRQVRSDGIYFEQSLYYHVYAMDCFLHARALASVNGIDIPRSFDETLQKMADVLATLCQAGTPHSFGDDDGGRLFDPRRNRADHLSDPLALSAIAFRNGALAPAALTEEAIWLFGERAESLSKAQLQCELTAKAFPDGGIFVLASSKGSQQMLIDAGPQGEGTSGHGHADALSLTLSFDSRAWLIDPGTYAYITPDGERDEFRGTAAHNTLRVDGLDQALPDGPFAWSSLPNVQANSWIIGSTFSLFKGSHDGYRRLADPVVHRRFVVHIHDQFWLIRDLVEGKDAHDVETSWHFAADLKLDEIGNAVVGSSSPAAGSKTRLALVPVEDGAWRATLGWGEVSPAYGVKEAAPLLRIGARVALPAECALLIAPLLTASTELGNLVRTSANEVDSGRTVSAYHYAASGNSHHFFFADGERVWSTGSWSSDAEFIYCVTREGEALHFIACGGSFAKLNGELVFSSSTPITSLEWLAESGLVGDAASLDKAGVSLFQSALTSRAVDVR